jgi:hypothetical protein
VCCTFGRAVPSVPADVTLIELVPVDVIAPAKVPSYILRPPPPELLEVCVTPYGMSPYEPAEATVIELLALDVIDGI